MTLKKEAVELWLKSILLRPRSGLDDDSPALQRWGQPIDPFGVREADD